MPLFSLERSGKDIDVLLVYDMCATVEGELSKREHRRGKP